jgi:hypothetical protein
VNERNNTTLRYTNVARFTNEKMQMKANETCQSQMEKKSITHNGSTKCWLLNQTEA